MTVLQWWLSVHLVRHCSLSDSAAAAITSQICHCHCQPAMNNLYEYSTIARACLTDSMFTPWLNQLSKLFPGHETCGWTCHDWWQVDTSRDARSREETIARLALQCDVAKQQFLQTGSRFKPQDDFVAALSASVTLDWDDIWGQTAGIAFLLLLFLSAAPGRKITAWCQKLFLFSSATSSSTLYLPKFSPLGLTCLVPRVINVEDHSADKLKLD